MRSKHTLLRVILLACLFFNSQSVYAHPLCLKEGVFLENIVVASNVNIDKHFEICSWCGQNKGEFIRLFLSKIHEKKVDYITSVLSYMIGENLSHSDLLENKILGQQYIQYSFDLVYKHGITTEQHLKTLAGMDNK